MTTHARCPLDDGHAVFLFQKDRYSLYLCDTCGLQFVWPLPEPDVIREVYGEGYRPEACETAYLAEGRSYAQTRREKFLRVLPDRCETKSNTLLDIGCGLGFFLEAVRGDFKQVRGIEISEPQRLFAQRHLGLEVLEGEAASIPLPDESEDIITLLDVLEHLPDPRACLREVRRVLAPEGLVALVTPNPESLTARILKQRWVYYSPPEHLHLFPPRSLLRLLEGEGFRVLTVRTDSLLLNHILEIWRKPEAREHAMRHSTAQTSRAIRGSRLLKAGKDATNALLAHWHVGDKLRVLARKRL